YMLWLSGTTLTTSNYSVYAGHTYSFISLATNNVGLGQSTPGTAQSVNVTLQTPVVTVTSASANIITTQSLSVTVAVTGIGTPTGTVTLASGPYTSASAILASGAATIVIPAGALASGLDALTVSYTPDAAGALQFASAIGTASVTVGGAVTNAQVSVGTSPSGQAFSVDGVAYTSTQSFTWTVGSVHSIATISPQTLGGVRETFSSWSDGGALAHSVTATSGTANYTAAFGTSYLLSLAANPTFGGTIAPATGTFYLASTVVSLTATPASGYAFTNWSGAVANNTSASTTIAMNAAQTVTGNFTLIPMPVMTLSPSSLVFTSLVGTTSAVQTFQLANTGSVVLNITGISIGGTGASSFAQTNTCGTSVAAGTNCTVSVTFASTSAGNFAGTLSVASNATGTAPTVALSGTATAPATFTLTAAPTSQTVSPGGTATYVLSLTPQGGTFANAISLTASGLPTGATATFAPSSVTPGSSVANSTLTIRVPKQLGRVAPLDRSSTVPLFALLGCVLIVTRKRRRLIGGAMLMLALLCILPALIGCGGTAHAPSNSTITITAISGTQSQTATVSLTVE
ncbi:MAG: choice-of-anchor D domain-containing protein, partial [Bryocella sp.]